MTYEELLGLLTRFGAERSNAFAILGLAMDCSTAEALQRAKTQKAVPEGVALAARRAALALPHAARIGSELAKLTPSECQQIEGLEGDDKLEAFAELGKTDLVEAHLAMSQIFLKPHELAPGSAAADDYARSAMWFLLLPATKPENAAVLPN